MTMPTPDELRAQAAFLLSQATELETTQLTRADLAGLDPEAIVQAKSQGRLDHLLGYTPKKEN
jgi:hypothetical protein